MKIQQQMKRVIARKNVAQHVNGEIDVARQSMEHAKAAGEIRQHAGNSWLQVGRMRASGPIAILALGFIVLCYILYKFLC